MLDLKYKEAEVQTLLNQAKTLYAEIEALGHRATAEDRQKLDRLITEGTQKRDELDRMKKFGSLLADNDAPVGSHKSFERFEAGYRGSGKSWGEQIIESEQFKTNDGKELKSVYLGPIARKALYSQTDATGGGLVTNDHLAEVIDIARQRPLTVMDLVNKSQTTSDNVEYVELASRTNAAAPVVEWDTSGTPNFGLKPESNIVFALRNALVKTIATWIPASNQLLADAPRLRDTVDQELVYMIENVLETQMISGNGTGQSFTGILNWSGIQTRVHQVSGRGVAGTDTLADTLRRAITDINLAFYKSDGIVLNPADGEKLELLKTSQGAYIMIYDPVQMKVWRVPVVETAAMTAGTAVVAAFQMGATLWDRMQSEVRIGQPNDYFLRNAVALLAELRAAFAVVRPSAFEKITGIV